MSRQITIVGGGIVGLTCAYYLQAEGHHVRIIEQKTIGDSCALGNAGYISPSHFVPLASPGMVKKGLRWLLDPESPFYLHPRIDPAFFSWLWQFNRFCTRRHVEAVKTTLFELCTRSRELYLAMSKTLADSFSLQLNGCYILSQTAKGLESELKVVEQAQQLGMQAREVSARELQQSYPDMQFAIEGAVYFPEDAHVHPGALLKNLHQHLVAQDVEIIEQCRIDQIELQNKRVKRIGNQQQSFDVDELIITAGSWSPQLGKLLGTKLPIQAGKGYSVTIDNPWQLDTPMILNEAAVAITPFKQQQIRFGGTMEFAGLDLSIDQRRVSGILKSVKRFLPNFEPQSVNRDIAWSGLRPCSPDGLPLIGRPEQTENVIVATGHAMLGLTLAPVTGELVTQIVAGGRPKWSDKINPQRFK